MGRWNSAAISCWKLTMMKLTDLTGTSRENIVRDWVRRRLGSVAHELRVARSAKMLFDLTRRWHGLSAADARLLVLGALTHDVGRSQAEKKHALIGAEMVMDATWLPLSDAERRRVAYLTRHHKGKVPDAGTDKFLSPDDDTEALRILLGLLRVADSLDSRWMGGPRLVMTVHQDRAAGRTPAARVLSVFGYVDGPAWRAGAVYAKRKKLELLEETLRCEVKTEWYNADVMAMVG